MHIDTLMHSPFFLSLVIPSVLSFPVDWNRDSFRGTLSDTNPENAAEIWKVVASEVVVVGSDAEDSTRIEILEQASVTKTLATPSPALELRDVVDRRNDGGCIVFVNARDPNAAPARTCGYLEITEREVPTVVQEVVAATSTYVNQVDSTSTQEALFTPIPISTSEDQRPQTSDERQGKHFVDEEMEFTAKREDSDSDSSDYDPPKMFGDTRLTPFINARDASSEARDTASVVERNCQGPDAPDEPLDIISNTTRRGVDSCPYVNARDARPQDH